MARPRLGEEPYGTLTVRLEQTTVEAIKAYMAILKAESRGLRVDMGGTVRRLLDYGLEHAQRCEPQKAHAPTAPSPAAQPTAAPQALPRPRRARNAVA